MSSGTDAIPVPLHGQECFRQFGPFQPLPVAEQLAQEILSLPVFPAITHDELSAVVDAILEFADEQNG